MSSHPRIESATQLTLYKLALACLIALTCLSFLWELWLAPLRPGGSWLVLKVIPLLLCLRYLCTPGYTKNKNQVNTQRKIYTLQWTAMLLLVYVAEGIVRGISDSGLSARLAWIETILAVTSYSSILFYLRPFKLAKRYDKRS